MLWVLSVLLLLLLLQDAVLSARPPSPVDVVFHSVNLQNVIKWSPGNDTPPDTHYLVQYYIYGDKAEKDKGMVKWRAVQHCQDVARSWCDLTNETWDLEDGYYARVRAVDKTEKKSKWTETRRRFEPKRDTSFGPPTMSVAMEEPWAVISLKGPMRYQPDNHTPEVSMATIYPTQMDYIVSVHIHNGRHNLTRDFPVLHGPYQYRLIEYETEYCFSVKARFQAMPIRCQASHWHCITTPQDPVIVQLRRVIVGIVVPSLCVCMIAVAGYLLYRSLRGTGHKTPHAFDLSARPDLTLHPENITINKPGSTASLCSYSSQQTQTQPHPNPVLPDLLSYAPHRPSSPQEEEEARHHPRWEEDLPCVDYGFVGAADATTAPEGGGGGEEEESGGGEDGGSEGGGAQEDGWREVAGGGGDAGSERKETRRPGPAYAPQAKLCRTQAPTTTRVRTEDCAPVTAAHGPSAAHAPGERPKGGTDGGIFVRRDPRTGLFRIALPLRQAQTERADDGEDDSAGMAEGGRDTAGARDGDGGVDGGRDAGKQQGAERGTPLLSPYALQCGQGGRPAPPPFHGEREVEYMEEDEEEEEEEEGTNHVDWDPETGRLLVPRMEMEKGGRGTTGEERGCRGEEERVGARLECVMVRQASGEEKEEEAKRRQEEGETEGGSWESDALLTRWSLKVHMDP